MNYKVLETMKAAPNWVLYGKPGSNKPKAPYQINGQYGAKANDNSTWGRYDSAVKAAHDLGFEGVGYELTPANKIICIDLDHHFKGGNPDELANEFLALGDACYWELSRSGEGMHIYLFGSIPANFKNETDHVEMYSTGRYIACTFNEYRGTLPHCDDTAPILAELYTKYATGASEQAETPPERKISVKLGMTLNREDSRLAIRQNVDMAQYLRKSGRSLYNCPFCGSGTGKNHTGAFGIVPKSGGTKWHCFSCGRSGDVIDLYMNERHCDYNTALRDLAASIGITIARGADSGLDIDYSNPWSTDEQPQNKNAESGQNLNDIDYTTYYAECKARVHDPDAMVYINGRGISAATAEAYNLGYDPAGDPTGSGHKTPRIIVPVTKTHYIARRTDLEQDYRVLNSKGGEQGIFNVSALYSNQCVFITEGPFDALSFIETGFPAVSVNSTDNIGRLLAQLDKQRTGATLILALDNDDAGKAATQSLMAELGRRNIRYTTFTGSRKDPNESLVYDRAGFAMAALDAYNRAEKPDSTADYINHGMFAEIEAFQNKISTGWRKLDETANGGLYSGLYVIGAVSSLGKTSFMLQMADQVAAGGTDVIFFSLEQSRLELVSKSLGRYTALLGQDLNQLEIRANSMARNERSKQAFDKACAEYLKRVGNRMNIVEANYICDALTIGEYVRDYVQRTGSRPLVIIDYLQALKPPAVRPDMDEGTKDRIKGLARATAREQVDYSMVTLKQLTRELSIPVVAVCSVSRTNYMVPFDLESLKESGGIEYSADVVWGIQFHCLSDDLFTSEGKISDKRRRLAEEKQRKPRKLDLVCRKNRFGQGSFDLALDYYPANDLFIFPNQFLKAPNFRQHDATGKYNDLDTIMKML